MAEGTNAAPHFLSLAQEQTLNTVSYGFCVQKRTVVTV